MIGWLQKGGATSVEESLLAKRESTSAGCLADNAAGPLAAFDQGPKPPVAAQPTAQPPSAHTTGSALPQLTPTDRAKFTRLFAGAGPANGLITGDKARDIFIKSGLSYEKLGQIWQVAVAADIKPISPNLLS